MKLEKIVLDKKYDILTNVKNAFVLQAISYAKVYELLHKQIWRKVPSRIGTYSIPNISTFNGRPVTFIRWWNIKSYSTAPYSYSGGDHTFGLNQLFMEQDYRKEYIGNPKDGIYHDDCYITPKMIPATNEGYYDCWGYYTGSSFDTEEMKTVYAITQTWDKQNATGEVLINTVSLETYSLTVGSPAVTTHYKRIRIDYKIGEDGIVELGSYDPLKPQTDGISIGQSNNPYSYFGYRKWKKNFDEFSSHGTVVTEFQTSAQFSLASKVFDYGWIRVYQDGTVIEYVPESGSFGGENDYTAPAHYKILPMMYTDTGDLVMDRVEFVERWNDYFELVVHEDSEWWQSFIKPIAVIITIIVAIYTGIIFNPIGAIGTALSVVGTLSGNRTLGLIGGIMMLGAGMYEMGLEGYANQLYEGGAVGTQADVIGEATFGKAFEGLPNIGLENLAKIGSKIYSITNDIKMLGMKMPTMEQTVENDSGMSITIKDDSEEDLFAELYKMIGV